MAASTIPNSGGPGSSIELSAVTIAVRDKVIEKFSDQPLDQMNESVKQLLSKEDDEQKRLGILAARVYILRQRIIKISEGDPDRVIGSASPKAHDLVTPVADEQASETTNSEWTRLRILDDCEVNGVRFPKTVIIDVKSEDAEKLIANGNAELVEEEPISPQEAPTDDAAAEATGEDASEVTAEPNASAEIPAEIASEANTEDTAVENMAGEDAGPEDPVAEDPVNEALSDEDKEATGEEASAEDDPQTDGVDDLSALSAALESTPTPQEDVENLTKPDTEEGNTKDATINTPSAEEVTAALEALGAGSAADGADKADAAATGEHANGDVDSGAGNNADSDAADVAAELEAMAAAMTADPSSANAEDAPAAPKEDTTDEDADKPSGWFAAQQKAEQSSSADTMTDESANEPTNEPGDDGDDSEDAKA